MIKLRPDLHTRTTPHTSPLRANYGVSSVSYTKKNDRDISNHLLIWLYFHFRILVMDQGRVAEFDTPRNLLNDDNSIFHSMAKHAGLTH